MGWILTSNQRIRESTKERMGAYRLKWSSKMRVLVSQELKQELVSSRVSELSVRVKRRC